MGQEKIKEEKRQNFLEGKARYERKYQENKKWAYYLAIEPTSPINFRSFCVFTLPLASKSPRYPMPNQQNLKVDQRSKIALSIFNQSNVKNFMSLSYYLNGPMPHKRALMREVNRILKELRARNTQEKKQMRERLQLKKSELAKFKQSVRAEFPIALKTLDFFPDFVSNLKKLQEMQKEVDTFESDYEYLKHCSKEISDAALTGISSEEFFLKAGPPTTIFESPFYQERWLDDYLNDSQFITIPF